MKKMAMTMRVLLAAEFAVALLVPSLTMADAATRNIVRQVVDSSPSCPGGSAQSTFDGANLWQPCSANTPDLYRYGVGAWELVGANSTSANTPDLYRYGVGAWELVDRGDQSEPRGRATVASGSQSCSR